MGYMHAYWTWLVNIHKDRGQADRLTATRFVAADAER